MTNVKSLQVGQALSFNYPLQTTSSMIVKIGVKADNGVGPDGDIVAFSRICQHQGCLISYLAGTIMEGNCPCHGSQYDFLHNGNVATGPTTLPSPTSTTRIRRGDWRHIRSREWAHPSYMDKAHEETQTQPISSNTTSKEDKSSPKSPPAPCKAITTNNRLSDRPIHRGTFGIRIAPFATSVQKSEVCLSKPTDARTVTRQFMSMQRY